MDLTKDLLISSPGDALLCPSCGDVFRDPVIAKCGHTFCLGCSGVNNPLRAKNPCFICQTPIQKGSTCLNNAIAQVIDNLPARCPHHGNACMWTGTAKEVRRHTLLCSKAPTPKPTISDDADTSTVATCLDSSFESTSDSSETGETDPSETGGTDSSKKATNSGAMLPEVVMTHVPMRRILDPECDLLHLCQRPTALWDSDYTMAHLKRLSIDNDGSEDDACLIESIDSYREHYLPCWVNVNGHDIIVSPGWHVSNTTTRVDAFQTLPTLF